jgi:NitT/TauT family transport system ATP-binding protein
MQISISNLSFAYPSSDGPVFAGLNLSSTSFECLALLGTSGAGKSTLLKLIADCLAPSCGTIQLGAASSAPPRLGYVSQDGTLLPWLSVSDNIRLSKRLVGMGQSVPLSEFDREILQALDLTSQLDALPYELSGGMRKRVCLTASLLSGAGVHLLDEPFNGSDMTRRRAMYRAIRRAGESNGSSIIFTTHDAIDVIELADVAVWLDGSANGSPTVLDASDGWTESLRATLATLMFGGG